MTSREPDEIAARVARRTVYSDDEIRSLCRRREVLSVLFRQARLIQPPIPLSVAVAEGVLSGPPQSIVKARGGIAWLRDRVQASPS